MGRVDFVHKDPPCRSLELLKGENKSALAPFPSLLQTGGGCRAAPAPPERLGSLARVADLRTVAPWLFLGEVVPVPTLHRSRCC